MKLLKTILGVLRMNNGRDLRNSQTVEVAYNLRVRNFPSTSLPPTLVKLYFRY